MAWKVISLYPGRMMIGLRHLNHVEALAEHGTFSGAAQALGISQPALSRSIRRLEHQLGVTLFDRGGAGGVEPTLFGRLLVARGATLLQESRELIREVQLLQGLHTGELTVCAGFFPAALSVHLAVGNLLADYPGIRCRVHVADWREGTAQVLARRADLAVAELSAAREHPQLEVVPLARHAFLFRARAGHPILRLENPAIEDLLAYPWVGTRAPARITTVLPSPPFAAGSIDHATGDFVPAVLVGDLESTERVLARGNAIGPGLAWRRDPPGLADALVPIPFTAPWMRLDYGIIRLRDRSLSPAAQAFVDELRKIEATLPPS